MVKSLVNSMADKYAASTNPKAGNEDDAFASRLQSVVTAAKQKADVASSDRRHVLISVLKDNSGAVALEYVLTYHGFRCGVYHRRPPDGDPGAQCALFDVAVCLADIPNCASVVTAWIDGEAGETGGDAGGDFGRGNRSGLWDGTNPGVDNSPNEGVNNPGGLLAVGDATKEAREAAKEAAEEAREAVRQRGG